MPELSKNGFRKAEQIFCQLGADLYRTTLPRRPRGRMYVERELRYLMRLSALNREIDISRLPKREISQAYFPDRFTEIAVKTLCGIKNIDPKSLKKVEFTKARVRRFKKPGSKPRYYLEAKGPKGEGAAAAECPELSARISRGRYFALLKFATEGKATKVRHLIFGEAVDSRGEVHPLRAQIDVWKSAGRGRFGVRNPSSSLDMVTLDVEIHRRDLGIALRCFDHSFHFLASAVLLSGGAVPELSNRRLAKNGFDRKAVKALKKLIPPVERFIVRPAIAAPQKD